MIRKSIVVVAFGVSSIALAQTPIQQIAEGIPPEISQKQEFVRQLVEDQSVANRIQASQQTEAKRLLELARINYSKVLSALKDKDYKQAESQLNEAMSAIGKARRLVPDTEGIAARQPADYKKTLDEVESLEKSCLSYLRRVKLHPGVAGNESESRITSSIRGFLDSAKSYANAGQWDKALQEAEKADQSIRFEMGRVLGLMAVEYIKTFDTPAEEYAYKSEYDRNLLDLIPVVVSELRPSEDIKSTIDDLIENNSAVMGLAEEYARLKDYSKALINVNAGIGYLVVALTSAGLIMPQVPETR